MQKLHRMSKSRRWNFQGRRRMYMEEWRWLKKNY
jgi:hypothetical protein